MGVMRYGHAVGHRAVPDIMFKAVSILVLASASYGQADAPSGAGLGQFSVHCAGDTMIVDALHEQETHQPFIDVIRIDLGGMRYCTGACAAQRPIAAMNGRRIVLDPPQNGGTAARPFTRHWLNLDDGHYLETESSEWMSRTTHAICRGAAIAQPVPAAPAAAPNP